MPDAPVANIPKLIECRARENKETEIDIPLREFLVEAEDLKNVSENQIDWSSRIEYELEGSSDIDNELIDKYLNITTQEISLTETEGLLIKFWVCDKIYSLK